MVYLVKIESSSTALCKGNGVVKYVKLIISDKVFINI